MKLNWIIKRKAEFSLAERSFKKAERMREKIKKFLKSERKKAERMKEKIKKFLKSRRILFVYTEED